MRLMFASIIMPDVWASRLSMIPGEAHRDRIINAKEGKAYLDGAQAPFLLRDAAVILLDCSIRPEECFRLRWENDQNGVIEITHGKTDNARHRIPLSQRAQSVLEMRRGTTEGP